MVTIKDPGADIPLPNEQAKTKIRKILLDYDKENPGVIRAGIKEARDQALVAGVTSRQKEFGEVNKSAQGRHLFELPEEVGRQITRVAPYVFKSKVHLRWFIKHFRELLIPERY